MKGTLPRTACEEVLSGVGRSTARCCALMGRHERPQWLSPAVPAIAQEDLHEEDQHEERKTSNGCLQFLKGRKHMTWGCFPVWWQRSAQVAPASAMPEPRQRRGSNTLERVASAPCNQRIAAWQRPESPDLSLLSTTVLSNTRQMSAPTGPDGGICARSIDANGNLVAPAASLLPHSFCGYMSVVTLGRPAIDACGNTAYKPTHDTQNAALSP